jgi:Leucine-rich repeat (LRR) protein/gamma-glutamylcyclotransferase (GGCT)/AIG2-like uncharacterized protein YtfP
MRNLRKILNISEKEFANLHNLKKLDIYLRDEYEKEFPIEVCKLTNLEELDIFGEFKELPKEFCNLQNLKKLTIGDFETFPIEICKLTNLEKLIISDEFTELPKEFSNLQNLKELDIDFKSKELPLEICQLTNLEKLSLGGDFKEFPREFLNLQNLKCLSLGSLENFPVEICHLRNLEDLSISGNFSKIPKELSKLQNLKKLNLNSNVKDVSILQQLPNLESLEISLNQQKANQKISIKNLINLKTILIQYFKSVEILNLPNLKKLSSKLEEVKISNLPSLEEIEVRDFKIPAEFKRQLKNIYFETFNGEIDLSEFPNLKELSLDGGSFSIIGKTELKSLSIQHTRSITELLPKLESLEELYLRGIRLNSKPNKIFKNFPISKKLKKVSLCNNGCSKEFPKWIRELSELEYLSLDDYCSTEIPDWIDELQNLKEISIDWSSLERVSEAVTNLKNLEELHLSMNHIKKYPQNLEKLKNLKELYIDEEKISFDEYNRIKRALPNTEISEKDIEIFVYGTLKKGFWYNEQLLKDAKFIGKATTEEKYPMISENGQYPYLIDKEGYGKKIEGEIYRINSDILNDIDLVEGYPKHYSRREIKVREHMTCQLCWRCATTYFANFEIDYSKYELLEEFKKMKQMEDENEESNKH